MAKKVWLSPDQVKVLENNCKRLKDRCIIKLGAYVGLRANEIASVKVKDLREDTVSGDIEHFLQIKGKQTNQRKGSGKKKEREAYVPTNVYSDLRMLINQERLKDDSPLVPNKFGDHYSASGIRERVYKICQYAYQESNDDIFQDVSSHDLRRYFAHHNLVELGRNPRVIMSVGGWESWQAIEPYLDKPSKENIVKELG